MPKRHAPDHDDEDLPGVDVTNLDDGYYMLHLKIIYCSKIADYLNEWIEEVWDLDYPFLCVFETGKNGSKHWHCQGVTHLTEKQLERKRCKLIAKHGLTEERDRQKAMGLEPTTPHLITRSTKEVNSTGYQYMMKTGSVLVRCALMTQGQLEALQRASDAYVEKLKKKVSEHLMEVWEEEGLEFPRMMETMPRFIVMLARMVDERMEANGDKTSEKHFRKDLLKTLKKMPGIPMAHKEWIICEYYGFRHP